MDWLGYVKLTVCTLIPMILTIGLYILIKKWSWFKRQNYWHQQLMIGIVYGALTFGAFWFGVEYSSITSSGGYQDVQGVFGVANAIPLISGLIFGGPSGFFAGTLAAISRLFMYRFGSGDFLRAAECITVFISGGLTWLLRVTLFDNKKPKWFYGFVLGLLIEVIHMLLIFSTALYQQGYIYGYGVIRVCDIPCFITVAFAITFTLIAISLLEKDKLLPSVKSDKRISTKIQKWFAATFIISILFTFSFTYYGNLQTADNNISKDLTNNLNDVKAELQRSDISLDKCYKEDRSIDKDYLKNNPSKSGYNLVRYRRINKEGYLIVLEAEKQQIISVPYNIVGEEEEQVKYVDTHYIGKVFNFNGQTSKTSVTDYKEDVVDTITLKDPDNNPYVYYMQYCHYQNRDKNQNYYVIGLVYEVEAKITTGMTIRLTQYLELLMFITIFGVIYLFIKRVVVLNMHKINKSLDEITSGNLNVKVEVRSNQEFSDLSDDINQTVDTLKKFIEEANKRIDNELEYAKKIQQNSLPVIFPSTNKYDLFASMHTAKQVGGDFYDFFPVDNNHLLILIADVSGKGIPAAMFMMRAKTLIKSLVQTNELTLDYIISGVNDELNEDNKAGMFVTCWCGILNTDTGDLEFVNCGHNRPLVRKRKKYSYLDMQKNCILGVIPGIDYKMEKIKLAPGDAIFLYTDGVTEATSKKKELYGDDRLLEYINKIEYSSSAQILGDIYNDVDEFQKGAEQADDITMLMVRFKPNDK